MVKGVFITPKPCCLQGNKGLKSLLSLVALMKDKYPLHIINKMLSVANTLRDLLYIYRCRDVITSNINNSHN